MRKYQESNCKYFPCHDMEDLSRFNCRFCYCPLYRYGDECGGNFIYLDNGIKDCSHCVLPHTEEGCDRIISWLFEKETKDD